MTKAYDQFNESLLQEYCQKRLKRPDPVKLFMGLIISPHMALEDLKKKLEDRFGPIDLESPIHIFDHTDYYTREMGPDLKRSFLSFLNPVEPEDLAAIKGITNRMEIEMGRPNSGGICRMVNMDPGLLSLSNIILATTKNRAHRIYLSNGMYAEVTLMYSKDKGWQPLDWTYPDYQTPLAMEFFMETRKRYYFQIKDRLHNSKFPES